MATLLVKHRVANFDTWKTVFDEFDNVRRQHGWTGYSIHRDALDPNVVVIVNHVKDIDGAKKYGSSDTLKAAMAKAGVQGPPEISFLEDVVDVRI